MASKRRHGRAHWRRLPKPLRQGDLDGLCGVYSTVNAVRVLCPELDREAAVWLFNSLMWSLPKGASAEAVVTEGLWRGQLARVIRRAIAEMTDEYGIALTVTRPPKRFRSSADLETLWVWLDGRLSPTRVVILGVGGRRSHWTVAIAMTAQQIRLYDSGGLRVLRRSGCTVGRASARYSISPVQVFVVQRRT